MLVVGAGVTGIHQLYRAVAAGFSARAARGRRRRGRHLVLEPLPGRRFDSESYTYGYLFSRELFDEWEWQEHFAAQPETERYLNHVVDRFDLRRHMRFGAAVTSAEYDDTTGRGPSPRRRLAVPRPVPRGRDRRAVGAGVPRRARAATGSGASSTTRPAGRTTPVDFAGKRVAVVGTGSSGVQVVPAIADEVASLTVYQRTANWCTPLNNAPITTEDQARLRADFDEIRDRSTPRCTGSSTRRRPDDVRRRAGRARARSTSACGRVPASASSRATTPTC